MVFERISSLIWVMIRTSEATTLTVQSVECLKSLVMQHPPVDRQSTLKTTANRFIRTREYARQLAESKAQQAEPTLLIQQLQNQMETMIQKHAENQQGSPHLSGSRASRPTDPGSSEALQGP